MKMKTLNTEDSVILVASWNDYCYLIVILSWLLLALKSSMFGPCELPWTLTLFWVSFSCHPAAIIEPHIDVIIRFLSLVWFFAAPWTAAHQASLSFTISGNLLKLLSIESVMPSNHLILRRPLLLLPSIFPSIRVFSNESILHIMQPKYWSFSFSISPSNEYSGLISFRMGWLDLLAVQGTLTSLLQHHSSKHQFFSAQLSS